MPRGRGARGIKKKKKKHSQRVEQYRNRMLFLNLIYRSFPWGYGNNGGRLVLEFAIESSYSIHEKTDGFGTVF